VIPILDRAVPVGDQAWFVQIVVTIAGVKVSRRRTGTIVVLGIVVVMMMMIDIVFVRRVRMKGRRRGIVVGMAMWWDRTALVRLRLVWIGPCSWGSG
jgi:hypothetical protein